MDASSHVKSERKKNICLFCGEPVEYGWVSDYKGTKVWICRNCVIEGELGELMATAIFDRDRDHGDKGREVVEDINRCLETTQLKLYKNALHNTFEQSLNFKKTFKGRNKNEIGNEDHLGEEAVFDLQSQSEENEDSEYIILQEENKKGWSEHYTQNGLNEEVKDSPIYLSQIEKRVLAAIIRGANHPHNIIRATSYPEVIVRGALERLRSKGYIDSELQPTSKVEGISFKRLELGPTVAPKSHRLIDLAIGSALVTLILLLLIYI